MSEADPWPDGEPLFRRSRVSFGCPHCGVGLRVSPPRHSVTVGAHGGVSVSPFVLCPTCFGAAEVSGSRVLKRGFRLPSSSPLVVPAVLEDVQPSATLEASPPPLESLSRRQLVDICEASGLPVSGSRKVLIKRILDAEASDDEDEGGATPPVDSQSGAPLPGDDSEE